MSAGGAGGAGPVGRFAESGIPRRRGHSEKDLCYPLAFEPLDPETDSFELYLLPLFGDPSGEVVEEPAEDVDFIRREGYVERLAEVVEIYSAFHDV